MGTGDRPAIDRRLAAGSVTGVTTEWLEDGPADGPLMFFLHGWPERGLVWRAQVAHFAARGWRCVAPDLRGYGESPVPAAPDAYALSEVVADMLALHDSLGGAPAVWVGHDWGSPVAFSLAAHHPERCRAVASLCVPYLPDGFALDNLVPLVDRERYPADRFPDGQWGYYRFYLDDFERAVADFDADPANVVKLLFRPGSPAAMDRPARAASVAEQGGWFGPARRAPDVGADRLLLPAADYATVVAGLRANGFRGPCSWYLNDAANIAYAAAAPLPRLAMPVLMVHAAWDTICDTTRSRLADPMRAACTALTEATVPAGHSVMLEEPVAVNEALASWLDSAVR